MKNALRQDDRLLSYSEAQGEYELREVLSDYIREKRNVVTSPNRIVIGAGCQFQYVLRLGKKHNIRSAARLL